MRQLSRSKKKIYTCVKVEVFIKSHSTLPLSMYIFIQSFRFMKICWLLHRILHQCIYVFRCYRSIYNIKTSKYFANRGSFISNSSSLNFRMLMGAYCVYIVPLQYRTITHPSRVYSINPNFKYPLPPPFDQKIPTILRFIWYEIY